MKSVTCRALVNGNRGTLSTLIDLTRLLDSLHITPHASALFEALYLLKTSLVTWAEALGRMLLYRDRK